MTDTSTGTDSPRDLKTSTAGFLTAHRWELISGSFLLLLLSVGLYLRIHNLPNWFSYFNDYDEGAYVLNARSISQGLLPYRDFDLFQPPLYHLILAGVFKVFGSTLMVARHFSVAFSLVNVILIYAIARRTLGRMPAVVAAIVFALDPILLYLSRRAVLEHFGLTFCLVGILFLTFHFSNGGRKWLAASGVALGLALGVKLNFLPLVAGVLLAVAYLKAGGKWSWLARFGTAKALLEYMAVGASVFALIVLLKAQGWDYPLPVLDSLEAAGTKGAGVGFAFLFLPVAFVLFRNMDSSDWKGLMSGAWRAIRLPEVWIMAAPILLTFVVVLGPFLIADPRATFQQVFGSLTQRPSGEIPSYLGILYHTVNNVPGMLKLYALTVLATVPVLYLLLRTRTAASIHYITAIGLAVSLISLQLVFHVPRYYIAVWPFLALGAASLFMDMSGVLRIGKTVALVALTLMLCGLSLRVTYVNRGYDTMNYFPGPEGGAAYMEVADLITSLKPHAKVFCPNPMLCAVSPELVPPYGHDTFALLFMEQEKIPDIMNSLEAEGVDFIVLDPWIRVWKTGIFGSQADEFQSEVRSRGKLVGVVGLEDTERYEVYALNGSVDATMSRASTKGRLVCKSGRLFPTVLCLSCSASPRSHCIFLG